MSGFGKVFVFGSIFFIIWLVAGMFFVGLSEIVYFPASPDEICVEYGFDEADWFYRSYRCIEETDTGFFVSDLRIRCEPKDNVTMWSSFWAVLTFNPNYYTNQCKVFERG